jgi:hypothetical protein
VNPVPTSNMSVSPDVRQSIADGIHLFFNLVDHGKAGSTAVLFTETAKLTFGPGSPNPGTIEGSAIRDAMAARERQTSAFTRHVVTNMIFASTDGDVVSVTYILTLFRSDDESRSAVPAFVADVAETWVSGGQDWKLAERTISPTFARA